MEIRHAIKTLRQSAPKMSQESLAREIGISWRTVARYEAGDMPQSTVLVKLERIAFERGATELAEVFRQALSNQLGTWDTTGFTVSDLSPKSDSERLWIAAILAVLRNPQLAHIRLVDVGEISSVAAMQPIVAQPVFMVPNAKAKRPPPSEG